MFLSLVCVFLCAIAIVSFLLGATTAQAVGYAAAGRIEWDTTTSASIDLNTLGRLKQGDNNPRAPITTATTNVFLIKAAVSTLVNYFTVTDDKAPDTAVTTGDDDDYQYRHPAHPNGYYDDDITMIITNSTLDNNTLATPPAPLRGSHPFSHYYYAGGSKDTLATVPDDILPPYYRGSEQAEDVKQGEVEGSDTDQPSSQEQGSDKEQGSDLRDKEQGKGSDSELPDYNDWNDMGSDLPDNLYTYYSNYYDNNYNYNYNNNDNNNNDNSNSDDDIYDGGYDDADNYHTADNNILRPSDSSDATATAAATTGPTTDSAGPDYLFEYYGNNDDYVGINNNHSPYNGHFDDYVGWVDDTTGGGGDEGVSGGGADGDNDTANTTAASAYLPEHNEWNVHWVENTTVDSEGEGVVGGIENKDIDTTTITATTTTTTAADDYYPYYYDYSYYPAYSYHYDYSYYYYYNYYGEGEGAGVTFPGIGDDQDNTSNLSDVGEWNGDWVAWVENTTGGDDVMTGGDEGGVAITGGDDTSSGGDNTVTVTETDGNNESYYYYHYYNDEWFHGYGYDHGYSYMDPYMYYDDVNENTGEGESGDINAGGGISGINGGDSSGYGTTTGVIGGTSGDASGNGIINSVNGEGITTSASGVNIINSANGEGITTSASGVNIINSASGGESFNEDDVLSSPYGAAIDIDDDNLLGLLLDSQDDNTRSNHDPDSGPNPGFKPDTSPSPDPVPSSTMNLAPRPIPDDHNSNDPSLTLQAMSDSKPDSKLTSQAMSSSKSFIQRRRDTHTINNLPTQTLTLTLTPFIMAIANGYQYWVLDTPILRAIRATRASFSSQSSSSSLPSSSSSSSSSPTSSSRHLRGTNHLPPPGDHPFTDIH